MTFSGSAPAESWARFAWVTACVVAAVISWWLRGEHPTGRVLSLVLAGLAAAVPTAAIAFASSATRVRGLLLSCVPVVSFVISVGFVAVPSDRAVLPALASFVVAVALSEFVVRWRRRTVDASTKGQIDIPVLAAGVLGSVVTASALPSVAYYAIRASGLGWAQLGAMVGLVLGVVVGLSRLLHSGTGRGPAATHRPAVGGAEQVW